MDISSSAIHSGALEGGRDATDEPTAFRQMSSEIEEALGKPKPGAQPSESYIDQPYSGELYGYLRGTPKKYNYILTPAARKDILRRVSWYLLSKDEHLADLVPLDEKTGGAPREELQDELEIPIEYTEVRRGQPCGHVFKRGEGVYRCKNCSMDDTCVLCTRCFQATDHTGHDTSFSVNSGTGGCCDCGDPEAWKIPLRCRHHSSFEELEEVGLEAIVSSAGAPYVPGYNNSDCPTSVKRSIELTIAVVLEFILETFATSPASLSAQFDEVSIMEDAKNASLAIGDHEQQQKYAIVLWNDEVHSYQDVIDQCTEALQCSQMEAKKIAETVDTCGRDVLRVSASIPELVDIATTMVNVSLSVSIRAARDVFREQLSASLLIWLRDMACCKFRPLARVFQGKINNAIRSEISYQLCLRWVAPYRNVYLADILDKLYDYNLPESDYGDEYEDEDEEDDDERENDEDGDVDDNAMDEDERDYSEDLNSKGAAGYFAGEGHRAIGDIAYSGAPMHISSAASYPMDTMAEGVEENAYARGRRRRRSESEDSLRRQGEERASPRGYIQPQVESGDNDIQPSLWLAEPSRHRGESRVPASIHAAMGAAAEAVDAARTSLARIIHPSTVQSYPAHSMAPGAYPHSAIASESEPEVQMQEAAEASTPDADSIQDVETTQVIRHVFRGCGQQRLDWFLVFDLQLWKEVRSGLRELYMATLMLDSRYKMKIALTFARNYPRLSRAFLTQDRAPEHSVLLFSVQLFTAPTLSASLVEHHHFMYIILDVLKKFFMQPTPEFLRRYGVILCDTESFRNRRYFHVFHDMRYLAGTPQVRNWVSSKHHLLSAYLSFIGLFQGMNPNCRAALQHVEFEADTWVNAFNVTLQVAKSCRQFAECYGIAARDLFFALRGTLRVLSQTVSMMAEENSTFIIRNSQMHGYLAQNISVGGDMSESSQLGFEMHTLPTLWGKQYEIVRYDISSNPVSFHHPLHWFMAELFQHVKHLSDDRAQDFGFASMQDMVFSAFDTRLDSTLEATADSAIRDSLPLFSMSAVDMIPAQRQVLRILDYPIRVCVVMAQIRAGLWVRNGYIIRLQSHHYREVSLRENTYDQDIVMIQFFLSLWPDTDHILMTLLDRFGLYDWFSGRPQASRIYEPMHMQYMVEEFLNVLIVLVSERHVATGKNTLDMARREIVHGCLSSVSYSELSKKIPERLAENTEFDNLLQQMADYRGPTGIMDFGQYELKDEYLDEVDPYFIHYSRNQREEVEEVLRERLRKRKRKNTDGASDVVDYSPPKLETIRFGPFQRIGMALHTPLACQVLFYALLHATHTSGDLLSETMVDEALHLIVIALEDGQHGAVAREIGMSESSGRGGLWKYALEQGYPAGRGTPMNLLGLVLTLGLKPEMRQWKDKLDYIYQLFRKGGARIVSCIDDYYAKLEATPMGSRVLKSAAEEAKAAERKKQAAKARQAAIMAEFASQQQSFMSQYGDEFAELTDDESLEEHGTAEVLSSASDKGKGVDTQRVHQPLWSAPCGACIVCQEECDGSRPYGSLALIQANRAVRTAPLADAAHVVDILRLPSGLDTPISDVSTDASQGLSDMSDAVQGKSIGQVRTSDQLRAMNQIAHGAYGATSGLKGFPVMYHQRGLAASTCGHMMHMRCFMQYCQGIEAKRQQQPTRNHPENLHRKEYLCPLCKSLGNVLLPALPGVPEYDPLAAVERDPSRFESQAAQAPVEHTAAFERWLSEDWKPFGKALGSASGAKSPDVGDSSGGGGNIAAMDDADASVDGDEARRVGPDTSTAQSLQGDQDNGMYDDVHTDADAAATQSAGGFPFGLTDGLADSIPRLDDVLRGAQRLPSGLGFHALLSRFLPQLAGSALGIAPGTERLMIPLSRIVRWLVSRQVADSGGHQHRKPGADSGSHASTPDIASNVSGAHAPAELETRFREQMEGYQYMYSRLYEVLRNVQRDNHVGLPSPSLFEHLSRSKEKASAATLVNRSHGYDESPPIETAAKLRNDDDGGDKISNDGTEDEDVDEGENEDDARCDDHGDATMHAHNEGRIFEAQQSVFRPFLQNILDHIRVLGANGGPQPAVAQLTGSANGSLPGQLQGAKSRLYPFDKATNALIAHTIEVLELSQRGVRNPPVFDYEDSRTLPSGTLTDGVSEPLATFMHSLSKIAELQYRSVLGPASEIGRSVVDVAETRTVQATPAQRLHALIVESHQQLASSSAMNVPTTASMQGDILARTRLGMLTDLGCSLAPLIGSQHARSREFLCEQSRWLGGSESTLERPFLMQDTFAKFAELSHSLVAPFGLDIWHLTRLFLTAELVRVCIAVGDSLLGEYSSAPKALRIAQSLPFITEDSSSTAGAAAGPPSSARSGRGPTSHLPQPWVDAPEARDANLPSIISSGSDASMLETASNSTHALVIWTIRQLQGPDADADALERLQTTAHPVTVMKLVATLVLPFLRRVVLLLNLQYGLDIAREAPWLQAERQQALGVGDHGTQVLAQSEPECARLLKLLNIPGLHQLFDPDQQPGTLLLVEGWIRELRMFRRRHTSPMSLGAGCTMAVPVAMPTLYSLVELPDRFEVLFERSAKAFCPRCNGIPSDPALCLLCGSFVCAQSFCCEEDGIGECNMHMKTCGGTVGVYLLVKKCGFLLLHHDNGWFMSAPYLDQHGEVDLGLKRGRPLFINNTRYEEMRRLVLTQKIPVFIARKIDQDFDIGGWISL